MKKLWILPILCVFLAAGCNAEPETVRIGFSAGLTGKYSELGVAAMYGAQIAVSEVNQHGGINGREVELLIRDDGNALETAIEADRSLAEEHVVAIVGHLVSALTETVDFANDQGILLISPTISTEELTGQDDNFLRLIPSNYNQSHQLAMEAMKDGYDTMSILYEWSNRRFSKVLSDELGRVFTEQGGTVQSTESFDSTADVDYLAIARGYAEADVNALALIASGYDIANFAQAFSILGHEIQLYAPSWGLTSDLILLGGTSVEGVQGVSYQDLDLQNANYSRFCEIYQSQYGQSPIFASVFAYEAVMLIAESAEGLKEIGPETLKDRILEVRTFEGMMSPIQFDAYGDVIRPVYTYEVKDGGFVMKPAEENLQ